MAFAKRSGTEKYSWGGGGKYQKIQSDRVRRIQDKTQSKLGFLEMSDTSAEDFALIQQINQWYDDQLEEFANACNY